MEAQVLRHTDPESNGASALYAQQLYWPNSTFQTATTSASSLSYFEFNDTLQRVPNWQGTCSNSSRGHCHTQRTSHNCQGNRELWLVNYLIQVTAVYKLVAKLLLVLQGPKGTLERTLPDLCDVVQVMKHACLSTCCLLPFAARAVVAKAVCYAGGECVESCQA